MKKRMMLIAALVALSLIAASCSNDDSEDTTTTEAGQTTTTAEGATTTAGGGDTTTSEAMEDLSGTILISGSSTVEPISARVAEAFSGQNPNVAIDVKGPGTGDGFAAFCVGETDISDASRAIKDSEAEECAANGIEWIELLIAIDGLSVLTSHDNDIHSCLTFNDMYALLGPESTGFGQWSDAADLAAELGGTTADAYVDQDLVVTAPGEESGTYDTFVEFIFDDLAEERGVDSGARPDYQASANDNVIIEGIAGSQYSLGWVGFAFYVNNQEAVAALEVDDGESGCTAPTAESIADGSYPLSRPLFIYINANKLAENPALEPFVDYYLSDGLVAVADAGYVELDDYGPTQDNWSNKVIGRVFS